MARIKAYVPADQWCDGHPNAARVPVDGRRDPGPSAERRGGGFVRRLFGR